MVSVSWRIRWGGSSCIPSRHQHDEEWRNEVQVQDEHLEEIICLKLTILRVIMDKWRHAQRRGSRIGVWGSSLQVFNKQVHGYVKTFPKKRFSHMGMGEQFASLHQAKTIKKGVPSWGDQDRHHQAQVEYAQGKGMILIGFPFYWSHGACWETGL